MTIDFTNAQTATCPNCKQERLLGTCEGKLACLWCHSNAGEKTRAKERTVRYKIPKRGPKTDKDRSAGFMWGRRGGVKGNV